VLYPHQFEVNEAWIAFKLNDGPIRTEQDGNFDLIALMDAASCFILSSVPVPLSLAEPTKLESMRMLKEAQAHKNQLPKTLFLPAKQPAQFLAAEADRQGIVVVRVQEDQLLLFTGEARDGFRAQFGGDTSQ
jgi:hypothetical protein